MRAFKEFCQPRSSFFRKQQESQTTKPIEQYIFSSKRHQSIQPFSNRNYDRWNQRYSDVQYQNNSSVLLNNNSPLFNGNSPLLNGNSPLVSGKKISFKDMSMEDRKFQFHPNTTVSDQVYKIPPRNQNLSNQLKKNTYPYYARNALTPNRQYQSPFKQNNRERQNFTNHNNSDYYEQYIRQNNNLINERERIRGQESIKGLNRTFIQQNILLVQENRKLKLIVQNEYKPLKQLYQKLVKQQQDRDYLITKLQWKVKQLVKEMKNNQAPQIYNAQGHATHFEAWSNQKEQKNNIQTFLRQKRHIYGQGKLNFPLNKNQKTYAQVNELADRTYIAHQTAKPLNANFRYNTFNEISIIQPKIR